MIEEDYRWSRATFVLSGDELDPQLITQTLQITPTTAWRKGDTQLVGPRQIPVVRRSSHWALRCPIDEQISLELHLEWLLDVLEPKILILRPLIGVHASEFFCGFGSANGQGGCTFNSSLLTRLARFGAELALDLYPLNNNMDVGTTSRELTP